MPRGAVPSMSLVALLLITGCNGSDDPPLASQSSPNSDETRASQSRAASNPGEASATESTTTAGESNVSGEEALAWEDTPEAWLAGWASSRGIEDPPEVPIVRETRPEEMGELVADCVREQGFEARAFPDGSWETVGAPGQADAAALAEYVCIAQYPLQPQFYQPLDDARLHQSYDWHVNTTIPCLQSMGYTTPEPPTVEVYVETYRATGEQWMAQHVGGLPYESWDQCPPDPSADELFPLDG